MARARLDGLGEFVFERPEPEFVAETSEEELQPPVQPTVTVKATAQPTGYDKLFGGQRPSFKPVTR